MNANLVTPAMLARAMRAAEAGFGRIAAADDHTIEGEGVVDVAAILTAGLDARGAPVHELRIACPDRIGRVPYGLLTMNRRGHWSERRDVTDYWRPTAAAAARRAHVPAMRLAAITVTFHKATAARYDPGNLAPVSKAIVDGIVDAGVLPDDSREYLIGPDHRAGLPADRPLVVVTITELEDA